MFSVTYAVTSNSTMRTYSVKSQVVQWIVITEGHYWWNYFIIQAFIHSSYMDWMDFPNEDHRQMNFKLSKQ